MKCKYCQAELEANSSVCPQCGKDNLKDNLKGLKITALVLVCVVMVVLLACLICYGVTGSFFPDFGGDSTEYTVLTQEGDATMKGKSFEKAMDKVVATMGDNSLTNRELQIYFWMAAYNCEEDYDLEKSLATQIRDESTGETYYDYFLSEALDMWQKVVLMASAAEEAGYEMPESRLEEISTLDETLEYYASIYAYYYGYNITTADDFVKLQFGPGGTFDTYHDYFYDYYLGGLYWVEMMEELEVTMDQMEEYFTENEESLLNDYGVEITKDSGKLVDVRNIMIVVDTVETTDISGKTVSVEDWDTCYADIQKVYDEWLAGDQSLESFVALVEKYSEDSGTKDVEGLYTDLYKGSLAEVDVRHILVMPEGGQKDENGNTIYTDDAWAAAYAETESILNEWLSGKATEETFAELANTYSDDNNGNVTNGGLYEDVYVGQMVENFNDWCFDPDRQEGDYGIVRTEFGYHIIYFVHADDEADDWAFDESRQVGDVGIVKTDDGYMLLYYDAEETAWVRVCRYGVQSDLAAEMLEDLTEENPYTVNYDKITIGSVAG